MNRTVDLEALDVGRGGSLLMKRALADIAIGERVEITGTSPTLPLDVRSWARSEGHDVVSTKETGNLAIVRRTESRFAHATRAGHPHRLAEGAVSEAPPATWGLAARGALVEDGVAAFHFPLAKKSALWADEAARLYAQAASLQWDPEKVIDWSVVPTLPAEVESAVVQLMTYLIENETAALIIPARFLGQLHPHFREVMQLLAIQAADEARHIEIFTRRALLKSDQLGVSSVGGQASLKTLLDEPDFALASFLLSVLGEGSFLSLLWFLRDHGPDATTRDVARFAAQDEARHVAFGLAHLKRHVDIEPGLRSRLALSVERRHSALQGSGGLNPEVLDALVLLAAGSWAPEAIGRGFELTTALKEAMDEGRRQRLRRLGFSEAEAEALSLQHTLNFM
jgi:TusA-related sulfurtransferase